jgi:hypothetical protein
MMRVREELAVRPYGSPGAKLPHDRQIDRRERFLPRECSLVTIEEGSGLYGKKLQGF